MTIKEVEDIIAEIDRLLAEPPRPTIHGPDRSRFGLEMNRAGWAKMLQQLKDNQQ